MTCPTYQIHTLGCKVNQYDSGTLISALRSAGFEASEKDPDIVIVNTCCVTHSAIAKSRRLINKMRRDHPRAYLVLSGCWPRVYPDDQMHADLIWRDKDLTLLGEELVRRFNAHQICQMPLSDQANPRYFLKVQDGCDQFCSYCIIPYTRGRLASRSEVEILTEVQMAVKAGYREIVFTGIHIGLYGKEMKRPKTNLVTLIQKIIAINGIGRVRISSIEVGEVTDDLIHLMETSKKVCAHLHISLQSGSDKILALMNRPYDSTYFAKRVAYIRERIPDVAISTDIIVGFPGETQKDFCDTLEFAKKMNFSKIHVFPFSAHEKTPAFSMKGKVSTDEIIRRSKELRVLSSLLEKKYRKKFSGRKLAFVIEHIGENRIRAKSEYYFDIFLKTGKKYVLGKIYKIQVR